MTFIQRSLPPGDRDDAPLLNQASDRPSSAVAGSDHPGDAARLMAVKAEVAQLRAVFTQAERSLSTLEAALSAGEQYAIEQAAWRLCEALVVNLHTLAAKVRRAADGARRPKEQ